MGRHLSLRVEADRLAAHQDAQLRQLLELRDQGRRRVVIQPHDGDEEVRRHVLEDQIAHRELVQPQPFHEGSDHQILVLDQVVRHADDRLLPLHRQLLAVAIEDVAPNRHVDERVHEVPGRAQSVEDQVRRPVQHPIRLAQRTREDPLRDFPEKARLVDQIYLNAGHVLAGRRHDLPAQPRDRGLLPDVVVALHEVIDRDAVARLQPQQPVGVLEAPGRDQRVVLLHRLQGCLRRYRDVQ